MAKPCPLWFYVLVLVPLLILETGTLLRGLRRFLLWPPAWPSGARATRSGRGARACRQCKKTVGHGLTCHWRRQRNAARKKWRGQR